MLNPDLDIDALAAAYREDDRVRVDAALPADKAAELSRMLETEIGYASMVSVGGVGRALFPSEIEAMSDDQKRALHANLMQDASRGVGFLYEGHQIAESDSTKLRAALSQLNEPATLQIIRTITGENRIAYADGQATRYRSGHYLTRHLDDPAGENRLIAYVLSLTAGWHPDWGGLLQFYERDGTPRDAWAPGFNVLSLFSVRHVHAVTYVTPFAAKPRLSITGWFRAR